MGGTRQDKTGQEEDRQDKTRGEKRRQDKRREDKTRQDKRREEKREENLDAVVGCDQEVERFHIAVVDGWLVIVQEVNALDHLRAKLQ